MSVLDLKELKNIDIGEVSDGYHTFNELYHHRALLFASLVNVTPDIAFTWKSKLHDDGTMYDGMFIVGIQTFKGQATYHYDMKYWDLFKCRILDKAPKYDGHSPEDAINRIFDYFYNLDITIYRENGNKIYNIPQ